MGDVKELYLDLMKRTLMNWIYEDFDDVTRADGRDWPSAAHTMIGRKRLDNLQKCVESVLDDGVPGDFIEAGVWRGGSTIRYSPRAPPCCLGYAKSPGRACSSTVARAPHGCVSPRWNRLQDSGTPCPSAPACP